eukprot:gnl/TRDRNA2_/TRDRNA2_136148_c1_seq1.p1 gnl/TRDRNA2_/TRDRNA2_136148_c1~~gnl/TRDRNA2_/TRDRNA2_136148_c1_seq1.p1  ORF type:complete len:157 (-),score=19.02 gnl/TRDRNA2_/TRDRNA2_136148_c1_seq1:19-435(-)
MPAYLRAIDAAHEFVLSGQIPPVHTSSCLQKLPPVHMQFRTFDEFLQDGIIKHSTMFADDTERQLERPPSAQELPICFGELRRNSFDGRVYDFDGLHRACMSHWSEQEIALFWRNDCEPIAPASAITGINAKYYELVD